MKPSSMMSFLALAVALSGCDELFSRTGSARTSTEIVAARGTPAIFSIECVRHAYDASTAMWHPLPGFVRSEVWIYPDGGRADVVTLVNGEVIDRRTTDDDYSEYPNPGIDPRVYGCAESSATVEKVLGGGLLSTTDGTDAQAVLALDNVQLKVNLYAVNGGRSALQVMYSNDKLIGMVTL